MNRDKVRELFAESGLKYSDLNSSDLSQLRMRVIEQLKSFDNSGFKMRIAPKVKADFDENGNVKLYELRVQGILPDGNYHFKDREAITFNRDGFIGFAGWADGKNVQPFLKAFEMWIKNQFTPVEGKTKSITFDKKAQSELAPWVKERMKADREKALAEALENIPGKSPVKTALEKIESEREKEFEKSSLRGHDIYHDGKEWRYCDTDQKTVENWKNRPCGACGKENTPEGHDGCLGTLPGVINACCGHGSPNAAYVEFDDHSLHRGKQAYEKMKMLRTLRSMNPEQLRELRYLLNRFISAYQSNYPMSAEKAHGLRSTVTEIHQS